MSGVNVDRLKVYLASSFSLKERVQHVHDTLRFEGMDVPDVWWDESREQANLKEIDLPDEEWYQDEKVVQRAERHWGNIGRADAFAIVCPPDGTKKYNGANIELGYAIAAGVPCFSVGKLERSAMYEPVKQLDSAQELAGEIVDLYDTDIDQEVRTDGGRKQTEVSSEFVRGEAVPEDDAEAFVHIGFDDAYHPTGGYWFPAAEYYPDTTGCVARKYDLPTGELIQYPRDDKPPEIRGRDDLPEWVDDRCISDGEEGE